MARYSDDELRRLYEEGIEAAHQSENDAEWEAFLSSIKKLEEENPCLRNYAFMTERLEDSFVSAVRESGRAIPDDCTEQIAKLVLLCDEPLMASPVLNAILENRNDPIETLGDAIRMAEVTMNAKFTCRTQEESEEAIVSRFVEYSEEVGDHLEEVDARKFVNGMRERSQELRGTGLKFEDLGEYASQGFVECLQNRGLMTRQVLWYSDSITLCLQMHTDPYLAAVTILQMASRDSDPTEGLAGLLDTARGLI
jgi:hypothetical protein